MFATLSPKDAEVIEKGDEDVFFLYVVSHIFLGAMFKWHRRLGNYFFPQAIVAVREDIQLDPIVLPVVIALMAQMGYARNGIMMVGRKPAPYTTLTVKGITTMNIWAFMGKDIVQELIAEWRRKWGHDGPRLNTLMEKVS